MKGKFRRVPTTVHIPTGTLDIIDDYLEAQPGNMSRSDFINAAIDDYMRRMGLTPPPASAEEAEE
jgi:hypothetical protein